MRLVALFALFSSAAVAQNSDCMLDKALLYYPTLPLLARDQGTVTVRLTIDEKGRVTKDNYETDERKRFVPLVQQAVRGTRFHPVCAGERSFRIEFKLRSILSNDRRSTVDVLSPNAYLITADTQRMSHQ